MRPNVQPATADEHVFLIGRPPLGEYLGFITAQTVDGRTADQGRLADEWRAANDHIRELEAQEPALADSPPITAVAPHLDPVRQQILNDPVFRRVFAMVPADIAVVELDRLVVFQKHINLRFVRELQTQLGTTPTDEEIFRFALLSQLLTPAVRFGQVAGNQYVFVSPSTDFRFLESVVLRPEQVTGFVPQGPVSSVIALVVGYGTNYLNTIHAENRLILSNGSHRAYALRDLGITHAPCVVRRVSRRDELEVIASAEVQQKPDLYLRDARPPLLKDYFDPSFEKSSQSRDVIDR